MEGLRVRDLFDPDDLLAQWVFTLSATVADLGAAEALFKDALDADAPAVKTLYLYRQMLTRLYEAERVVAAIEIHEPVRNFLADLPMSEAPANYLRDHFLPIETSKAREIFGYVRHRTVHHAHVGSPELREALANAGDQIARILVDTERNALHYEWPEAVISHALSPDLGADEGIKDFADRATLAQEIVANFAALLRSVMHPYAERVGVNVDLLYHDIREA
jgi:hypothetical protein